MPNESEYYYFLDGSKKPATPEQARIYRNLEVLNDCRFISSGTIGLLTGEHLYSQIDKIRLAWLAWAEEKAQSEYAFRSWAHVWKTWRKETLGMRFASEFGPEYMFLQLSQDLEPLVSDYNLPSVPSGAMVLVGDAEILETWVCYGGRPFDEQAEYIKVG